MCTEKHRKPTQRGSEEGGYSKKKTNQMYGEQHDRSEDLVLTELASVASQTILLHYLQ